MDSPAGGLRVTWIVMKDDVQEVLVAPRDVILVLLVQGVKQVPPGQTSRHHAVLWDKEVHPKSGVSSQAYLSHINVLGRSHGGVAGWLSGRGFLLRTLNSVPRMRVRFISMTPELRPVTP